MKKIFYCFIMFFILLCAVSCKNSKNKSDEFKPSLDKNRSCDIRIVGSYDNFESLEAEFDKFNKYYPNVNLSYEKIDDYNNTLFSVLEGKDKPNIFFSNTWMIGNSKYDKVVSHMEDLSDSNLKLNLDCIREGLINKSNGKILMLPVFSRTYGMLINENIFKKEKINIPSTWTELKEVCNSFNEKGYDSPMMGYSEKTSSCLMNTIAYPAFVAELAKNPEALALANNLDSSAGEYLRPALEKVDYLIKNGCVDITECDNIKDNYKKVLLRFFEGDVPMMICTADTVSGTKKRETESEAFQASPFDYSFSPIPFTDEGGYFIDSPSVEFSVNKDCENLDMTNEFMRFLISTKELNEMASSKRLVTPTKDMSFHSVYSSFSNIPSERIIFPEVLGITDQLSVQTRVASYKVGRGLMTIDEAVLNYGNFEDIK